MIKLEIISIDGRLVKKVNFNNNQPLQVNVSVLMKPYFSSESTLQATNVSVLMKPYFNKVYYNFPLLSLFFVTLFFFHFLLT